MDQKNSISPIIAQLAAEPSKLGKQAILEQNKDNTSLKDLFKMVLDPYHNFYLRSIPDIDISEYEELIEQVGELTDEAVIGTLKSYERMEIPLKVLVVLMDNADCEESTKDLLHKIIKKDLDCGVGAATVNKVWEGLIPTYEIMKAEEVAHLDGIEYPALCDVKLDGSRITAYVSPEGDVELKSSSGNPFVQLDHIKEELKKIFTKNKESCFDGFILDGELMAYDDNNKPIPRRTVNGLANKARQGTATEEENLSLKFVAFDHLSSAIQLQFGVDPRDVFDRRTSLARLISGCENIKKVESIYVESVEAVNQFYNIIVKEGGEGVIVKSGKSMYEAKRSKSWVKIKKLFEADVVVTDVIPHKKKPDQVGSIMIESSDGLVKGKVGTKLSQKDRKDLMVKHMAGDLVGKIITIQFHDLESSKSKKEKSFYIPRYIEERFDKTEADSIDKIIDMMENPLKRQ